MKVAWRRWTRTPRFRFMLCSFRLSICNRNLVWVYLGPKKLIVTVLEFGLEILWGGKAGE